MNAIARFLANARPRPNAAGYRLPHAPTVEELRRGGGKLDLPDVADLPPAFRRWFEGSKVVDEDGEPLVVFHGTRSPWDFEVFIPGGPDPGDRDDPSVETASFADTLSDPSSFVGPHFSESGRVALKFASGRAARWDRDRSRGAPESGRVVPVYLAIRNPIVFDSDRDFYEWVVELGASSQLDEEIYSSREGTDEADDEQEGEYTLEERLDAIQALESSVDMGGDLSLYQQVMEELGRSAAWALQKLGHDGVQYLNDVEGGGWSWCPLGEGRVKSALANRGTYDPGDDSILG